MADTLHIDLRMRRAREAMQRAQPRLTQNLRQLGAVGRFVPQPPANSQQTVVHGWITKGHTTGSHLDYLQQGKGRDGTDASLFGRAAQVDAQAFAQRAAQDGHQFRFSVGLEYNHPFFALRPYIETLMHQIEKDLKRPLDWVAAVHHDTVQMHAHVVLRGKDREERPLYITRDYLTRGLRNRAMQVATWLLGPRQERQQEQGQEAAQQRQPQRQAQRGHAMGD